MSHPKLTAHATRLGLLIVSIVALLIVPLAGSISRTSARENVLLEDQFNDNSNNWQLAATKSSKLKVSGGVLSLTLSSESIANWVTPDMTFPDDVTVQVETSTPKPSDAGDWSSAIILRADTRDTSAGFYQFQVTGSGGWGFVTRTANGDEYKIQKDGKLDNWDPTASNTLKVEASGNSFTFTVNDTLVGTFEDDRINNDPSTLKYVGLLVTTLKGVKNIAVEFRNFQVTGQGEPPTAVKPTKTATKPKRTPTKTPVPTQAGPQNGDVLLDEKFPDDNPNDWSVGKQTNVEISIANSSLIIQLTKKQWLQWTFPRAVKLPPDVDVTVTVINTAPDPGGEWTYGIGVRDYVDGNDEYMYLFEVSGNGKWLFTRVNGSKGLETIQKATNITGVKLQPKAANKLRVTAVGSHFEFYLNGKKIGQIDDDVLTPPDQSRVALEVGLYGNTAKIRAAFSDLSVVYAGS